VPMNKKCMRRAARSALHRSLRTTYYKDSSGSRTVGSRIFAGGHDGARSKVLGPPAEGACNDGCPACAAGRAGVRPARRERGSLERCILEALAASAGPQSPADVRAALGGDLAYTTVMTVLTRLADKGVVVRSRSGRGYVYTAAGAADAAAWRMHRLLEAEADRARVLTRFVDGLSAEDEQLLGALMNRANPEPPGGD
jgi:predicted transcriptional regulator